MLWGVITIDMELTRFAATAKVTAIERMGKERRAATLVALVSTLEATGWMQFYISTLPYFISPFVK
jgi:hypothetical protein